MNFYIGTANFLKKYGYKNKSVNKKEILKIFYFLKKKNFFRIDTAQRYDEFSKFSDKVKFKNSKISTKIFFKNSDFKKNNFEFFFINQIQKKIDILKIKKFETIFVHNFDDIKSVNLLKLFNLMRKLKKLKLTKMIGLSIYDPKSILRTKLKSKCDIIQAPVNIFNKKFLRNDVFKILKKNKIKLQARSIFLQGLLVDKKFMFKNNKKYKIINEFNLWCSNNKINAYEYCINFILNQKNVDSFVVGIENLKQLKILYNFVSLEKNKKVVKKVFFNKDYFIDTRKI